MSSMWEGTWVRFAPPPKRRLVCEWKCKLCWDGTYSKDPVADVNAHLRERHGKGFVCYDRRKRGEIA